jgi:hypothetical protein
LSATPGEPAGTPGGAAGFTPFTRLRTLLTGSVTKTRSWVALAVLVPIMAGLAQTGAGHSALRAAGLAAPPASYVALSFTDPQALPAQLHSKVSTVKVSFVIHDTPGAPVSRIYRWSVLVSQAGSTLPAAAGQVRVPAGGERTIRTTVLTTCTAPRLRLAVQLASPAESIDFWAACSPKARSFR